MHCGNTCIVALQNRVNQLQLELLQAKTGFSTLEAAFQELTHSVQLINADPMNFTSTGISLMAPPTKKLPPINKDNYPDKGKHGPAAFLEDDNGEPITEESLDTIRKMIRGLWFEFTVKGLLATTWSKTIHSMRTLFHSIMEEKHPLFRLAIDGWKLDLLCSTAYPSWRKNHLDADGNLLKQSKKVKQEDNDINYHRGTKRTCSPSFEGSSALKHVKAESVNPLTAVKGTSTLEPMPMLEDNPGTVEPTPMLEDNPGTLELKPMLEDNPTSSASSNASLPPVATLIPSPDASLPSVVTPIPPPSPKTEKENQPLTHACITLKNPLMGLTCQPLVKSTVPTSTTVLDTTKTILSLKLGLPSTSDTTVPTNIPLAPGNPAALPQVNDTLPTATISSLKKPAKMWPGPTKKGRNLCALRWLKQVTPGSTNEFNAYYSTLNEAQIQVLYH
ncbi:hypothetical protein BDR04DRAFT_1159977 [Suillus decipiens]|nr:hypothetical protein BDR04DRAFT_1159977 [Suillus decipiens]